MDGINTLRYSDLFLAMYFDGGKSCLHRNHSHVLVYVYSGEMVIDEKGQITRLHKGECAFIRKVIRTALAAEGVDFPCEIDVRLTDDETIHEINREMREVDRATDVLSFPMFELTPGELPGEEDADPGTGLVPLGDMVISLEHVAAQAKEYGHSNRRELAYLVTHSVLHLLGYDHLDEGPMKAQMREHEEAIMKLLELER